MSPKMMVKLLEKDSKRKQHSLSCQIIEAHALNYLFFLRQTIMASASTISATVPWWCVVFSTDRRFWCSKNRTGSHSLRWWCVPMCAYVFFSYGGFLDVSFAPRWLGCSCDQTVFVFLLFFYLWLVKKAEIELSSLTCHVFKHLTPWHVGRV